VMMVIALLYPVLRVSVLWSQVIILLLIVDFVRLLCPLNHQRQWFAMPTA
jgi:hypothetical protein